MKNILTLAAVLVSSAISLNAFAGGNIEAGKIAAEKNGCAACHGKDFNTPIADYPRLAGQHQEYLAHALTTYHRGAESSTGRGNAIMTGVVKPLSRKDIQDIAAYLHSLPGSLVLKK
ncbi:c-type cytochrome [soil metagenome]